MNDDRLKYGTDFTSVKVHQSPGGNSSLSLAWGEPAPRRAAPQQQRGQSWDNPPQQDRNPPRNQGRGYPEPRGPPQNPGNRGYQPANRGYQDPEPAYRDEQQWREEPPQRYEPEDQRRRAYDPPEPRYPDRAEPRGQDRGVDRGLDRGDMRNPERYEQQRYRGEEERMPPQRARIERPAQREMYGRGQFEQQEYEARPPRPQYEARGQPQEKGNVHTSVKVREPPGGRSNFIFG